MYDVSQMYNVFVEKKQDKSCSFQICSSYSLINIPYKHCIL